MTDIVRSHPEPLTGPAIRRLRGRTPIKRHDLRLSVLIPVYNEEATIQLILDQVHSVPVPKEIICVNDCSTDGTREIVREYQRKYPAQVRALLRESNVGSGNNMKGVYAACRG